MFNLIPWHRHKGLDIRRDRPPVVSLQDEINRLFDDFFGGLRTSPLAASSRMGDGFMAPSVDVFENENGFKVEAELPGLDRNDVEITANDHYLTIRGEKRVAREDKDENNVCVCRERYYGIFQRTVTLPETADLDKATATFKKGVLWVDIPKNEAALKASHKIEISQAA